jgi:hypothetical protein
LAVQAVSTKCWCGHSCSKEQMTHFRDIAFVGLAPHWSWLFGLAVHLDNQRECVLIVQRTSSICFLGQVTIPRYSRWLKSLIIECQNHGILITYVLEMWTKHDYYDKMVQSACGESHVKGHELMIYLACGFDYERNPPIWNAGVITPLVLFAYTLKKLRCALD